MAPRNTWQWAECLGRDGWDSPQNVPLDMGVEVLNMTLMNGQLGMKRPAASANVTLGGTSLGGAVYAMAKFLQGLTDAAAQLALVNIQSSLFVVSLIESSNTATTLTNPETINDYPAEMTFAELNGKLFIAYDGSSNRLKVYSPTESTSAIRFTGLKAPGAPTAADTGSGSYAATQRWYEVQFRVKSGGTILRASNLSAPVAFTPSGSGSAAQVTKPADTGEGATHWAVYASQAGINGPYYELAEIVVGTTTYNDSANPNTYASNPVAPLAGTYFPFPSVKYIVSDGIRLFGIGAWLTSAGDSVPPVPGRLYFTAPIGTTAIDTTIGVGDDECVQSTVNQNNWLDLSVKGPGGVDTGLSQPINGVLFAFQWKGVYMIIPTQQATAPFKRILLSQTHGNIRHHAIVTAEDETGAPAVYFLDPEDGPRRVGLGGTIQWLGKDVSDLWPTIDLSDSKTNLGGTAQNAFGIYWKAKKQVIWWLSTTTPSRILLVYHVALGRLDVDYQGDIRYGWSQWQGGLAGCLCGCMFPATLASTRPMALIPYMGAASSPAFVSRLDGTQTQDFNASPYQAYVDSRAEAMNIWERRKRITEAYLTAKANSSVSPTVKIEKDFGAQVVSEAGVNLAPVSSETRVHVRIQELDQSDMIVWQVRIGDASAINNTFELDRFDALYEVLPGAQ